MKSSDLGLYGKVWDYIVAERVGFEPTVHLFGRTDDFESPPLWPLRYLSTDSDLPFLPPLAPFLKKILNERLALRTKYALVYH